MKKFIVKSYGKKGEDVVNKNYAAVDRGEYEIRLKSCNGQI
jgi:pyruvate-ferredoxin/flavodoxin oxidoreductase